ncbi:BnaC09g30510D [Brassica napus]|uniref:BnaC09g30510D protein n=1 Tax=Brassica napus TaxID=3708 RepID=A0A078FZ22_BRANA|nr:BnaC09g30510D [Brassica napus]
MSEHVCFVYSSESVNGTNAGRKSLAEDKGPDVPAAVPADASSSKDKTPEPSLVLLDKNQPTVSDLQKEDARYQEKKDAALALFRAKSDRTRKPSASQQSPYTANSTARVIISNRKLYPGYNPFAPIDKKKLKELADWLKTCPHYRTALDKKPRKNRTWWYQILRTSLEWLEDCHIDVWINVLRKRYDANPQHFRSDIMCFLDHLFAQQWRFNFKDFKDSEPDQNGLGRRLPVNFADTHWIAMWISIPKRHIVVFDSICSSISPEELVVRPANIPPARAGDCGVYTLKYIGCHALGIEFSKKDFAMANGKSMRDKMAVDIFQELPDAHEFENKDMDNNLGAYDG